MEITSRECEKVTKKLFEQDTEIFVIDLCVNGRLLQDNYLYNQFILGPYLLVCCFTYRI